MNSNTQTQTLRLPITAGLLLATAAVASAAGNSVVKFSVDMTAAVQSSAFVPGTSHVIARGSFNNWSTGAYYDGSGSSQLTNNPSAVGLATNIYTGTFTDTNDANGATLQYKYFIDTGGNWEGVANRTWGLPTASGGNLVLPSYYFNDVSPTGLDPVTNSIEFQVDMTQQAVLGNFTPGTDHVFARGSFNNWGNSPQSPFPLTNNPAAANTNLYTGVFLGLTGTEGGQSDNPNSPQHYKYYIDRGSNWESPPSQSTDGTQNRVYNMLEVNGALVLPAVYFNDQPPVPPITNVITFQVDMTFQIALGRFNPPSNGGSDYVEARGLFNNWSGGFQLTNDPSAVGLATNVFRGAWTNINAPGTAIGYKFWDTSFPGNYETPASTGGGNRSFNLLTTNGNIVLKDVFFDDQQLGNIAPSATTVTFSINMTNAVGTDAHVFNPAADSVYLNGDFLGWLPWDLIGGLQGYQLTNNPVGSLVYTLPVTIPAGNSLALTYKFSINGPDNEAGVGQNHFRYIRMGTNYSLPLDTFANQYHEPESSNVAIGAVAAAHAPVSWLGHPGIRLQTRSSLTTGSWQDVPGTDGTSWTSGINTTNGFLSITNYPVSATPGYFRWIKPSVSPVP
jgi:hypothetical protein